MKRYVYAVLMLFLSTLLIACSSNKHEIIFDSMGGSQVETIKVEEGKVIPIPEVTREGYILEGWYTSVNGRETLNKEWLFNSDIVIEDVALYAKWELEGLVFDQETGSITDYTGQAKDVIIPSEINGTPVTTIGDNAFSRTILTSVTIPDSVIKIGDNAFYDSNFTSLTIPDSVITIGEGAFFRNGLRDDLTSITILRDETRFDEDWVKIGFPSELHQEAINVNGFLFFDDINEIIGYIGDDKEIVIPSEINGTEVISIGYRLFYGYDLTSVTIPDSVITIGANAFSSNTITSLTIPDSVTTIGDEAFSVNPIITIIILGDETRFNDYWEVLGFPKEKKPESE